jgi:FkbM family methyltransferase
MHYSQGNEQEIVGAYFGAYVGTLLDVGSNDGITYSNSLALIHRGWGAVLVEPSEKVFPKLNNLHERNEKVVLVNAAIGNHNGPAKLFDSGDFLLKGTCSLLSTLKKEEIKRWGDVVFEEIDATVITFERLLEEVPYKTFQFISIDCEGFDLEVLRQIDLDAVECKCICIEHNSFPHILSQIKEYVHPFGLKQIGYNAENIIMARI